MPGHRATAAIKPAGPPPTTTAERERAPLGHQTQEDPRATVYTLTEKGLEALREYAGTPVTFTPVKSDALLRLLIADLVGERVTRESMATLREDIADLQDRVKEMEARTEDFPHRRKYMLLVTGFLSELLELHLQLADEVERELADDAP